MTEPTYTMSDVSDMVGISKSTIRNYCKRFGSHLSDTATPPAGKQRKFTEKDISVLRFAATLQQEGYTSAVILARLDETDIVPGEILLHPSAQLPTTAPDAPQPPVSVAAMVEILRTNNDRMDALERAQRHSGAMLAYGFVAGIVAAVGIFWIVWLLLTAAQ